MNCNKIDLKKESQNETNDVVRQRSIDAWANNISYKLYGIECVCGDNEHIKEVALEITHYLLTEIKSGTITVHSNGHWVHLKKFIKQNNWGEPDGKPKNIDF